jgi:hypothetical protein
LTSNRYDETIRRFDQTMARLERAKWLDVIERARATLAAGRSRPEPSQAAREVPAVAPQRAPTRGDVLKVTEHLAQQERRPDETREAAIARVFSERPDLQVAWEQAVPDALAETPRPAVRRFFTEADALTGANTSSVWRAIETAADQLRDRVPGLTREQAIARVLDHDPRLAEAYRAAEDADKQRGH